MELPVVRADKRYFLLNYRGGNNDSWGFISAVTVEDGVQIITLRSILQVRKILLKLWCSSNIIVLFCRYIIILIPQLMYTT